MTRDQIVAELERLAALLDVQVRYERMGMLSGGLCRMGDSTFLLVNKSLSLQSRIELLANELRTLEWDKHFIKPEVRELLEEKP